MVQGLAQLEQRWSRIPVKARQRVKEAMEKAAYEVVEDMYNLAPQLTGDLAGSIGWTWGDAPAGSMLIGKAGGGTEYGAMVITFYAGGDDTFYARFQEFGTRKMAANPFFYPTWRIWKRRIKSRIAAAFRKALREA